MQHPEQAAGYRLHNATSLYLRLHAHQPVAWWPWVDEAFEEAKKRDVPVLLSVGYATCHWCHVMARESFDDTTTANLINEHFVAIKVDRELRPDVDAVYMTALQSLTGSGGWPMTLALDHERQPWWAGTYFPPEDRHGHPAFKRVLQALSSTWRERRAEVTQAATQIAAALTRLEATTTAPTLNLAEAPSSARASDTIAAFQSTLMQTLQSEFDATHGGFGGAPKFPPHAALRFLEAHPSEAADAMRLRTLRAMVDGGVTDQLGGALHRYAVDGAWMVPHFEVMLVDQAQALPRLARAARESGDVRLDWAASAMLAALGRDLRRDDALFATGLDAEAGGEEGGFHAWTLEEVQALFPNAMEAARVAAAFNVQAVGPLAGKSVLAYRALALSDAPASEAEVAAWRARMFAAREARIKPHRDEPAVAAYVGMMLCGLMEARPYLDEHDAHLALTWALEGADALWQHAWSGSRLRRAVDAAAADRDHALGLLDDQVYPALANLHLYRQTGAPRFLERALTLGEVVLRDHALSEGGFATVPQGFAATLVRARDRFDGATPASESMAALLMAELHVWTGDMRFGNAAEACLQQQLPLMARAPLGMVGAYMAVRVLRDPGVSVVVVGDTQDAATAMLLEVARRDSSVRAVVCVSGAEDPWVARMPLLAGRERLNGAATAYACRDGVCRLPAVSPEALREALNAWRA